MLDIVRKLYCLLDARERRNAVILLVMVLVMGALDSVSIASIMPFLTVASKPQIVYENEYLLALYTAFSFENVDQFLFCLGLAIFLFVLVGLVVKGATYWALARFTFIRNHTLSYRLLQNYLSHPYAFFLGRHSGDLGKSILNEVQQLIITVLHPAVMLVANLSTVVFLLILIVWVNPTAAVVATSMIGGSYTAVYLLMRKHMARIGVERVSANEERFRIAQEAFGGIKEIKAAGLEEEFARRFREPSLRISRHQVTNMIAGELPRYAIEAVSIGLVFVIILVQLAINDGQFQEVIPILGVYAFAGIRLLPALQQIYRAAVKLRFGKPALDALYEDFKETRQDVRQTSLTRTIDPENAGKLLRLKDRIELIGVNYTYPGADRLALSDVSLVIPANTTAGFVGTTGAGKTTVVDVIMGLLTPTCGELKVGGDSVFPLRVRAWQRNIGYVPQHIFLVDDTVAVNIAFGVPVKEIDMAAVERAARLAEFHDFVESQLPHGYDTDVGERGVRLSGGQIQRIGIARALYHDPDVLILDEATSALDNRTEKSVMDAVRNLGHSKTILLIAHRISTVRNCDTIFVLEQGELRDSGTYESLFERSPCFRAIAGTVAAE